MLFIQFGPISKNDSKRLSKDAAVTPFKFGGITI